MKSSFSLAGVVCLLFYPKGSIVFLTLFFLVMSDQNILLPDQDGIVVGRNNVLSREKIICSPRMKCTPADLDNYNDYLFNYEYL